MVGFRDGPLPSLPRGVTLTRVVVPAVQSRTNTCLTPLVALGARSVATEWNATKRPSPLMAAVSESSFPWLPSGAKLTQMVWPV